MKNITPESTLVRKESGELAPFSAEKLHKSLIRSGADEYTADSIVKEIISRLYEGVTTRKIYRWAFDLLRGHSRKIASKYHLKRGIMEMGPSGFPFEKLVSAILKEQGFKVMTGSVVQGKCVSHEIDVIAEKEKHHYMVECKYHNQPGTISDVKVSLYIHARFKDVESAWIELPGHKEKLHQGWIFTNTRFSDDAITYGTCAGLMLIGWSYPSNGSLRTLIDKSGLYPLTCLGTLSKAEKQALLMNGIVLCREIAENSRHLSEAGVKESRISVVQQEAMKLCNLIKNGRD